MIIMAYCYICQFGTSLAVENCTFKASRVIGASLGSWNSTLLKISCDPEITAERPFEYQR